VADQDGAARTRAREKLELPRPLRRRVARWLGVLPGPPGIRAMDSSSTDRARLLQVLKVHGKGGEVVLVPSPPAVARDRPSRPWSGERPDPVNSQGARMDRHSATRRLEHLAEAAEIRMPRMRPHMLRHTYVTTILDAGVSLRDVQIAARHATRGRPCDTTALARTSTGTELPPRGLHGPGT
jgi:integrase